jgi:hypothetical protein
MSDLIRQVRLNLKNLGGSELKAMANNEGLKELFSQRQQLISEMNAAKKRAIAEAAAPYESALQELDQMYSMMLQFVGDNGDRS